VAGARRGEDAERAHLLCSYGGVGVGVRRRANRGGAAVHRVQEGGPGGDRCRAVLPKVAAREVVQSSSGRLILGRRRERRRSDVLILLRRRAANNIQVAATIGKKLRLHARVSRSASIPRSLSYTRTAIVPITTPRMRCTALLSHSRPTCFARPLAFKIAASMSSS
jgi:hypothetical protein